MALVLAAVVCAAVVMGASSRVDAAVDLTGTWYLDGATNDDVLPASIDVVQTGASVVAELSTSAMRMSLYGSIDPATGAIYLESISACGSEPYKSFLDAQVSSDGMTMTGRMAFHLNRIAVPICLPFQIDLVAGRRPATCGNGLLDPGEQCDAAPDSPCCNRACRFASNEIECAELEGCRVGRCDGAGACARVPAPEGTSCPDHAGPCHFGVCDAGGTCVRARIPEGYPCNADGSECTIGQCDATARCVERPVPVDTGCYVPGGDFCRSGRCDDAGLCVLRDSPAGTSCPATSPCRAGVCDGAGTCEQRLDFAAFNCSPSGESPADAGCRVAYCDSTGTCVAEPFPEGSACFPAELAPCATGACDGAGRCREVPLPAGNTCRYPADACDLAETCDGVSTTCPPDARSDGPDADGDGTPFGCDDCTESAPLPGAVATIGVLPTSRERNGAVEGLGHQLRVRAELRWPDGSTLPDPSRAPLTLTLSSRASELVLSDTTSPVLADQSFEIGWRRTGRGWRYRHILKGPQLSGIREVALSPSPGKPHVVDVEVVVAGVGLARLLDLRPLHVQFDLDGATPNDACLGIDLLGGSQRSSAKEPGRLVCKPRRGGSLIVCR